MTLEPGYHVMSDEATEKHGVFEDQLSIVEFLRRVDNLDDLPIDMTVYGLDKYLNASETPNKTVEFIRGVLLDRVNYIFNQKPVVQFVVDEVEHWQGPVLSTEENDIRLREIFGGSLDQEGSGWYEGELNIQT